MGADEFTAWLAYDRISPIGPERADYMAAIIATAVVNSRFGLTKKDKMAAPADFLPTWRPTRTQTSDDQLKYVFVLNALFGGADERKQAA